MKCLRLCTENNSLVLFHVLKEKVGLITFEHSFMYEKKIKSFQKVLEELLNRWNIMEIL